MLYLHIKKPLFMRNIYISIILLLFVALPLTAQRMYVRANATGNNSGQSWTSAFTDLQSALQIAQKGDSIWIAEGLYRPTNTSNRAISFEPRSGVVVIGGFAGTETSLIQRDLAAHPTVLSGDIGVAGDSTDNSYNVMYLLEPDSATVLDGLILRDGVADNEAFATNAYSRLICGGGLYIMGASADAYPDIRNCTFEYNTALYYGGGVIVNGNDNGSTAPKFIHCRFENNRAGSNGGGIAKYGASVVERGLDYDNCQFIGNQANQFGGGIYYLDGEGRDKIELENCVLQNNTAKKRGGGAFFSLGRESTSTFLCKKVDFLENKSIVGAALDLFSNFQPYDGMVLLDSCLFRKNIGNLQSTTGSMLNMEVFSTPITPINIINCRIEENFAQNLYSLSLDGKLLICKNIFKNNNNPDQNTFVNALILCSSLKEIKLTQSNFTNNHQSVFYVQTSVVKSIFDNNYFKMFPFENFRCNFSYLEDTCSITNCTFVNGQFSNFLSSSSNSKKVTFRNNYFSNPSPNYFNKPSTNIYLSNNYLGGFDCAAQPPNVICLDGNITSGDPMFTDTAQGNYTPLPCSPLVHAGSNAFVGQEDSVDLADNPRIRGGRVDIGAFEAPAPELAGSPAAVGACPGSPSGAVTFDLTQACLPYQAQWSKNGVSGSGTTQLESGTYSFTLTDARGATCTATASIPTRDTFQLLPNVVPVQCGETEGGSASVSIQGASGPYSFLWSPAITDSLRTNLAPGNYPLTVTDALGCTARSTVNVDAVGNLDIDINASPITCYSADNGSLLITPLNGKPPFQFDWENGPASPTYGPLGPGVYKGTLTDAFGCRIVWILPLSEPDSLYLEANITPASDSVIYNGIIEVTGISGGTTPFALAWSNGATGLLLENLAPGAYTYTLTDAQGCTKTATYMVPLVVGTEEADKQFSISLWPNPANDQVFIRDLGQLGTNQCSIYNALGQVFYQASSAQLDAAVDIQSWPAGMYTCVVQGGSGKRWVGRFWVGR
jgi:predicted outer membrane repeat protein